MTAKQQNERVEMKSKYIPAIAILVASLSVFLNLAIAAQDKYSLKALNEVAFSEFAKVQTAGAGKIRSPRRHVFSNTMI
jgi:hypothetical protein